MNRTRKLLALGAAALAATALIAGCGDDDDSGGDADPAEVLRTSLGQETNYESGIINIGLTGSLDGATSGSIDASVTGPFQSGGEGQPPELDLDANATVEAEGIPDVPAGVSLDFSGGLALAEDSIFVSYQDTTYEASQQLYGQISPLLETFSSTSESTADPESADQLINSLSNLENEGTEEIDGESLTHIAGDLDFGNLVEEAGTPAPAELQEVFDSATMSLDFYVSDEDDTIRRVDVTFAISDLPEGIADPGFEAADFTFSVGISDPGSEQTIEAPTDAQPLDRLLGQFGTSEAEILQALQGAFVPGLGGGLSPGGEIPGLGTPGGSAGDAQTQECIAQAANPDEIIECLNQS